MGFETLEWRAFFGGGVWGAGLHWMLQGLLLCFVMHFPNMEPKYAAFNRTLVPVGFFLDSDESLSES